MKANGKNLRMFKYSMQDYMDLKPSWELRTIESKEKIDEFIKCMRGWSGTISNVQELSPIEYFKERQSRYWKGYEEQLDKLSEDCSEEFVEEYSFYVEHEDYDIASLIKEWQNYEKAI